MIFPFKARLKNDPTHTKKSNGSAGGNSSVSVALPVFALPSPNIVEPQAEQTKLNPVKSKKGLRDIENENSDDS